MATIIARDYHQPTAKAIINAWAALTRRLWLPGLELLAIQVHAGSVDLYCTGATAHSRDRLQRKVGWHIARTLGCDYLRSYAAGEDDLYIHGGITYPNRLRGHQPRLDREHLPF